jgi:hypothetical protein
MAWARIENGDFIEAETDLRKILTCAEGSGWFGLSMTYSCLANACLKQGKVEDALEPAREAVILSLQSGAQEFLGAAWRILGRAVAGTESVVEIEDEEADARACFTHSLDIFEEIQAEPEKARTLRAWGMYEIKSGDQDQGRAMWKEAREIFNHLGVTTEVEAMDQEMGADSLTE